MSKNRWETGRSGEGKHLKRGKRAGASVQLPRYRDTGSGALFPFSPLDEGPQAPKEPPSVTGGQFAREGDPRRLVEMDRQGRVRNLGEPLDWYCRRRPALFPACLYGAGDWLRGVYEQAMSASLSMAKVDPGHSVTGKPGVGSHAMAPAERAADRMRALRRALAAVGGPDLDEILLRVVCEAMPMADFERMKGWRAGAGQWILRIALYRLALHRGTITATGLPRWTVPRTPANENDSGS